jgi:hypothetical protein
MPDKRSSGMDTTEKMKYSFLLAGIIFINGFLIFSQENVPESMYVTSKEGLRQRTEPSLGSPVMTTWLYGDMIMVDKRSDFAETIDGITSYWYRTPWGGYLHSKYYECGWVFGGYLSETLPADLPVIVGFWDDEESTLYFHFSAQHIHWRSARGTSESSSNFTWTLNQDVITLSFNSKTIFTYKLKVLDRNTIILTHSDGTAYKLKRSNRR